MKLKENYKNNFSIKRYLPFLLFSIAVHAIFFCILAGCKPDTCKADIPEKTYSVKLISGSSPGKRSGSGENSKTKSALPGYMKTPSGSKTSKSPGKSANPPLPRLSGKNSDAFESYPTGIPRKIKRRNHHNDSKTVFNTRIIKKNRIINSGEIKKQPENPPPKESRPIISDPGFSEINKEIHQAVSNTETASSIKTSQPSGLSASDLSASSGISSGKTSGVVSESSGSGAAASSGRGGEGGSGNGGRGSSLSGRGGGNGNGNGGNPGEHGTGSGGSSGNTHEQKKPPRRAAPSNERLMQFRSMVADKINNAKVYPPESRRLGNEGRVVISFLIYPSGSVQGVEIIESSGFNLLDQAATDAAYRGMPYLPYPEGMTKSIRVRMTVNFRIGR